MAFYVHENLPLDERGLCRITVLPTSDFESRLLGRSPQPMSPFMSVRVAAHSLLRMKHRHDHIITKYSCSRCQSSLAL